MKHSDTLQSHFDQANASLRDSLSVLTAWPVPESDFGAICARRWFQQLGESLEAGKAAGVAVAIDQACRWASQSHIVEVRYHQHCEALLEAQQRLTMMAIFVAAADRGDLRQPQAIWSRLNAAEVQEDIAMRCPWLTEMLPDPAVVRYQLVDPVTGEVAIGYYDDAGHAAAIGGVEMEVEAVPFYTEEQLQELLQEPFGQNLAAASGYSL